MLSIHYQYMSKDRVQIGKKQIRALRERLKEFDITLAEVAQEAGCSHSLVNQVLNGIHTGRGKKTRRVVLCASNLILQAVENQKAVEQAAAL